MLFSRIYRKIKTEIYKIVFPKFRKAVMYEIPKVYFVERLQLGNRVHINDDIFIHAVGSVQIGDDSVLSHGVSIISTKNDINKWCIESSINEDIHIDETIIIGKHVWLCANVTVCSGVRIANNVVVSAGSVVINDLLEEDCLYGGVPARKIKSLKFKGDYDNAHITCDSNTFKYDGRNTGSIKRIS